MCLRNCFKLSQKRYVDFCLDTKCGGVDLLKAANILGYKKWFKICSNDNNFISLIIIAFLYWSLVIDNLEYKISEKIIFLLKDSKVNEKQNQKMDNLYIKKKNIKFKL